MCNDNTTFYDHGLKQIHANGKKLVFKHNQCFFQLTTSLVKSILDGFFRITIGIGLKLHKLYFILIKNSTICYATLMIVDQFMVDCQQDNEFVFLVQYCQCSRFIVLGIRKP